MGSRLSILPDSQFEDVSNALRKRLESLANEIEPSEYADGLFDPLMKGLLASSFHISDASEGTLWLADPSQESLIPVYNNGPNAAKFVGVFKQPLNSGLISMVYATEQPFCENNVHLNSQHDKTVDTALESVTVSMIAVPLFFGGRLRGVISCVRLKDPGSDAPDPPGFKAAHMRQMQLAAEAIQRLIEHRLLSISLGW